MRSTIVEPNQLLRTGSADRQLLAESLLDSYFADVHRLALSILRDDDEADDVAQDTFITALRHIDRYDPGTNLRAWLSTIAVNLCRDRLRRRNSRLRWRDLWSREQRSPASPSRNLESLHVRREANAALWASVNALDEKHRLPIILRYANGFSIREVADALHVPEGTVHSRLHHAIKKLASALTGTDSEALMMELFND
jgi:RNA polymerase sigma-70 factor (ECF subfamily)